MVLFKYFMFLIFISLWRLTVCQRYVYEMSKSYEDLPADNSVAKFISLK